MQYNVSFEVCAAIMLTIFTIFAKIGSPIKSRSGAAYINLSVCIIITCFMDITSALIINYINAGSDIPVFLAYAVNILYFIFTGLNGYYFCYYLYTLTSDKEKKIKIGFLLLAVPEMAFSIFAVMTPWTELLFYFDEDINYRFGSLHFLADAIIGFYMAAGMFYLLVKKKHFTPLRFISGIAFTVATSSGLLVQTYLMPEICIGFAAAAIAVMMLYFALQTPDPYALMNTLEELEKAKAELEETSKAKEDFLRHISHEMRTPVNSMLGMNSMILRKSFDKQITEYAETAEISGKKLLHLIDNILDYTQLSSGNVSLNCADYEVSEFFEQLIYQSSEFASCKGLELVTDISEEIPCKLKGDLPRIQQIIENLISNAIKFTDEGTVTLSAYHMPSGEEHIKLIISVTDTGCGISAEDIQKMSGSFIRLDEKKNADVDGAGLGLSVTKLLLALMKGRLEIESTPDKGSTFTVEIMQKITDKSPMGILNPLSHDRHAETHSFTASDSDVLIVDDSSVNLFVLHEFLKQFGIHADTANSGNECFEMATKKKYDIIFLDHMMPEPDGIAVMKMIRSTSGCASCGSDIIVVTANAVTGAREQYLSEGFTDYISKPVDFDILSRILLRYLPEDKKSFKKVSSHKTDMAQIFSSETTAHINTAAGLSLYNENRYDYAYALEKFSQAALTYAEELTNASENNDFDKYSVIAEKIRNHAFNIGAENLSDMAEIMYKTALLSQKSEIDTLHFDFITAINLSSAEAAEIYLKIRT